MFWKPKSTYQWKAWYTEGRVYDSESHSWQSLPSEGVLFVVEYKPTGRTIFNGGDWYYLDKGVLKYVPSKEWGVDQPKPNIRCKSCMKKGSRTSDEEFNYLHKRILDGDV